MKVEGHGGLHKVVEARGHGGKRRAARELHHVRVYAGKDATHENPNWIVEHHFASPEHEPQAHEFDDHAAMMEHLHKQTSTEPLEESEEGEGY